MLDYLYFLRKKKNMKDSLVVLRKSTTFTQLKAIKMESHFSQESKTEEAKESFANFQKIGKSLRIKMLK